MLIGIFVHRDSSGCAVLEDAARGRRRGYPAVAGTASSVPAQTGIPAGLPVTVSALPGRIAAPIPPAALLPTIPAVSHICPVAAISLSPLPALRCPSPLLSTP